MVSFSCDECQDVVTKPKVHRHLLKCRNASLSCLDCLKTFNAYTVTGHTSCISESEKYGPKTPQPITKPSSQTFCAVCNLQLNGAVHALQHYESKKHRAAVRRSSKTTGPKPDKSAALAVNGKQATPPNSVQGPTNCEGAVQPPKLSDLQGPEEIAGEKEIERVSAMKTKNTKPPLKRIMKQLVKNTPSRSMKKSKLVKAVRQQLGQNAPSDLALVIDKKLGKIRKLSVIDNRVLWVDPQ